MGPNRPIWGRYYAGFLKCIMQPPNGVQYYRYEYYNTRSSTVLKGGEGPTRLDGMMDHVRRTTAIPAGRHGPRVPLDHCRPTLTGPVPG